MSILPVTFRQFHIDNNKIFENQYNKLNSKSNTCSPALIEEFCNEFELPDEKINHAKFDENLTTKIASYKEEAVEPVINMLKTAENEKDITAGLFLLNRIIDAGAKGVEYTYPVISKFNYSKSHNVQVMLAGIYRKTQVPDGFGPLVTMFLKNYENPTQVPFDPNEEIGGAILEYLRNKTSVENYSKERA